MIVLTSLEVYNSILNTTEENNSFEIFIFPDLRMGGISCGKVIYEIEKDLEIPDVTATIYRMKF